MVGFVRGGIVKQSTYCLYNERLALILITIVKGLIDNSSSLKQKDDPAGNANIAEIGTAGGLGIVS